ncbi:MAG: VOC family protein [Chitinophagaceae bacterium]|nr:VOC family protein [Chitinophagaceae bacterium]
MITKVTHMCVYVLDQDSAYDFYVNKLGFKVHTDAPMGPDARWLTVTPPAQPELEITLFLVKEGGVFDAETTRTMRNLVKKGTFGAAVFTCQDLMTTYEELKVKGVEFIKTPTKEFYGYEALFKDDSGNWFSLSQLNPEP